MLESSFKKPTLRSLPGGPAGPFLGGFAEALSTQGYSSDVYLQADPTEKLEALAVMKAPALRPGKFRPPDRLIAALRASKVMRSSQGPNP